MIESTVDIGDKIGYVLFKKGIIDAEVLEQVMFVKQNEKGAKRRSIPQILVQDYKFDHDTIYKEVSKLYGFKTLNIKVEDVTDQKLNEIRKIFNKFEENVRNMLLEYQVLPLMWDPNIKDKLILATTDPTQKAMLKIIHYLRVKKYELTFIRQTDYESLIGKLFPKEENKYLKNFEEAPEEIQLEEDAASLDEELLEAEANKSALINLVEAMLVEGVRKGVSDIHIVPKPGRITEVHFRTDGKLKLWHTQKNTYPEAIISIIKDRARGFDRFERETAQDGFMQREIDKHIIRFRVSILPIVATEIRNKFESVVIRILDDRKVIKDLSKLGLTGYTKDVFKKAISQPQGMIILTGPTGSGKSTTLNAALHNVIRPEVNVLTVEDPVEYVIDGARQLKLGHKMNFEQALRSILRHDPDIVLVGEIRDRETAEIGIKLANTGHLTFSTLHTNDAPSAIARLYKMGVETFLLAYSINIIVAQRLIRKLCSNCKKKVEKIDEDALRAIDLNPAEWKGAEIYEAAGCDMCDNTGYKGRMAIHEPLYFTPEIRQLIINAGSDIDEDAVRKANRRNGALTLRESGFEKVRAGLTSFEEVVASTMSD